VTSFDDARRAIDGAERCYEDCRARLAEARATITAERQRAESAPVDPEKLAQDMRLRGPRQAYAPAPPPASDEPSVTSADAQRALRTLDDACVAMGCGTVLAASEADLARGLMRVLAEDRARRPAPSVPPGPCGATTEGASGPLFCYLLHGHAGWHVDNCGALWGPNHWKPAPVAMGAAVTDLDLQYLAAVDAHEDMRRSKCNPHDLQEADRAEARVRNERQAARRSGVAATRTQPIAVDREAPITELEVGAACRVIGEACGDSSYYRGVMRTVLEKFTTARATLRLPAVERPQPYVESPARIIDDLHEAVGKWKSRTEQAEDDLAQMTAGATVIARDYDACQERCADLEEELARVNDAHEQLRRDFDHATKADAAWRDEVIAERDTATRRAEEAEQALESTQRLYADALRRASVPEAMRRMLDVSRRYFLATSRGAASDDLENEMGHAIDDAEVALSQPAAVAEEPPDTSEIEAGMRRCEAVLARESGHRASQSCRDLADAVAAMLRREVRREQARQRGGK
jgi:hypothetical protein